MLLVHAHPDDETLATGGTIARYAALGVSVTVVTCTLGEEGEIIPPALARLRAAEADQLGGYRVGELRAACAALGVTEHRFLGGIGRWRDSGMVGTDANAHPRALVAGDLAEQVDALAEILDEVRPQVVISYGPDGGYGHPDHIRAHRITVDAARENPDVARVFYAVDARADIERGRVELSTVDGLPYTVPAPGQLPAVADDVITTRVDIAAHVDAKLAAMRAHATQISVWTDGERRAYALSNGIGRPVLDVECYTLASGEPAGADADLFGGLSTGVGLSTGAAPTDSRGAGRPVEREAGRPVERVSR
ncbi:MAG: N-acetyl-1-D-myo-inositol-2-amino-2-deoxy-alpha-D-glucopyranoside deacetylase [Sciscionella sp.]|nr:N-acetyl-1-D-myo-inositol-2-amino-2-deoxy-alpha-D-glucopyranoside deacetylase [Sciscionella sp.]